MDGQSLKDAGVTILLVAVGVFVYFTLTNWYNKHRTLRSGATQ